MNVKVKICGIRTLDAAKTAVDAGADFLGFNFVPTSKRYINPSEAAKIINVVRGKVKIVGIFQNADIVMINQLVKQLDLDFVQLHGQESQEYVESVGSQVIKAIASFSETDSYSVDYFLLDRVKQGEGEVVKVDEAMAVANKYPIFLAGGLTPQNVASVVKKVQPFAVDVAGGIESDGAQDTQKIRDFIKNAKGVLI